MKLPIAQTAVISL